MRRVLTWTAVAVLAIAATIGLARVSTGAFGGAPAAGGTAAGRTPVTDWGEPDLQGIWTLETDTPLQRPPRFATKEFLTDEERKAVDEERTALLGRDRRVERGTELDVAGAYNAVFNTVRPTGRRTSLIVDPPNGRLPARTAEAQKRDAADRAFRLALLQSTDTCKNKLAGCTGGTYNPAPSPLLNELPPAYNTGRMNRHDSPEDGSLGDRCIAGNLPDLPTAFGGNYIRVVQTAGGVSMFYDTGQGQGFQRNIVMNGAPHLPPQIHQWLGDSRGRWEGSTLVIDVTNFSPKHDFLGSRDHRHLVERWTRTSPTTLEYRVTIEDSTVWTRPWTIAMEYAKQNDEQNRIYYEPRCHEGNYGFPSLMRSARLAESDYAAHRGPNPATKDNATDFVGVEENPFNR
jgi:hypothetical protein